eukprot:1627661-Pyramimonas_sp.AAC.1
MATVSDRCPPGMARSNLNQRGALAVLGPPAGLEHGDAFADRSPPQGRQEEAGREVVWRKEWRPHCSIQNECPTEE